jgi:hypothetical protein
VGLGVTGSGAPDAERMGERAYSVCAPLAAILPAPPKNFRWLRPLLVPPLKMGASDRIIDYINTLSMYDRLRLYRKTTYSRGRSAAAVEVQFKLDGRCVGRLERG